MQKLPTKQSIFVEITKLQTPKRVRVFRNIKYKFPLLKRQLELRLSRMCLSEAHQPKDDKIRKLSRLESLKHNCF